MDGMALQYIWTLMTNTKTADTCHTLAYEKCNGTYLGWELREEMYRPMGPETIHCTGVTVSFCIRPLILLSLLSLITESLSGLVFWRFPSFPHGWMVTVFWSPTFAKKRDLKTNLWKPAQEKPIKEEFWHLGLWQIRVCKKRAKSFNNCLIFNL